MHLLSFSYSSRIYGAYVFEERSESFVFVELHVDTNRYTLPQRVIVCRGVSIVERVSIQKVCFCGILAQQLVKSITAIDTEEISIDCGY